MVKAFSFCLYGKFNKKYYYGLGENIEIIKDKLPDFKVYIIFGNDVDKDFIDKISQNSNVVLVNKDFTGDIIKSYRFTVIDIPEVELLFSRDADSRINDRDIWCINDFINSQSLVHIIRDHRNHTFPIMGGMCGFKKGFLNYFKSFEKLINILINLNITFNYLTDQIILANYIYSKFISNNIFLVHSNTAINKLNENNFKQIPLSVNKETFIGQIIDYDENNNRIYVCEYLE